MRTRIGVSVGNKSVSFMAPKKLTNTISRLMKKFKTQELKKDYKKPY